MQRIQSLYLLHCNTTQHIFADGLKTKGYVFLNHLEARGTTRFVGAQIGGLTCVGALITDLDCNAMHMTDDLIWTGIREPDHTNLRLSGASIGILHDDRASWPAQGKLHIQDFVYRALALHDKSTPKLIADSKLAPFLKLTPADRVEWLKRQPSAEQGQAQPWMQLAKLLETNGDADGAKWVIYEYRRQQAALASPLFRPLLLGYHRLEEQPLWIGLPIVLLGLFGSFIFWRARRMNSIALAKEHWREFSEMSGDLPGHKTSDEDTRVAFEAPRLISGMIPTDKDARKTLEDSGNLPPGYPPFNPVVYAIENVLPVVKLGQDEAWAPNYLASPGSWLPERPAWLRRIASRRRLSRYVFGLDYRRLSVVRWVLILLGWALALILAAAIGSRFKT